ncbi:hypothetical protein CK203_026892 [Vitis vinifera]|uniref:Uncharacterized protein n=1 Tax=Vitis vinifera TaxID=29760 RepID=A0A438IPA4_VITVI|nr:hypothetical protein CK203_026892 [Vitis vinifera]
MLLDLTKVKLWVEMLPNVVLPALLEVEDGAWTYIVAVSVTGEDDKDDVVTSETTRSKNELVKTGGCVSQLTKIAEGLRGSIRVNECYRRRLLPGHVIGTQVQVWRPKGRMEGEGAAWAQQKKILLGP